MSMTTIATIVFGTLGLIFTVVGVHRIITEPRRIAAYGYTILGAAVALLSVGLLLYVHADSPGLFLTTMALVLLGVVLGTLIGYPLLMAFLLWSGVMMLRRESRSLANMLSLVAGIGLLLLPTTLRLIEPDAIVREDLSYYVQYGLHTAAFLLVIYIAGCFAAFLIASLAYRWRKPKQPTQAVIVLGSGLINGKVPPLLAGRLKRGITAQQQDTGQPVLITSGGQGADEPVAEGVAMRDYVIDQGVDPQTVVAEDQSTSTTENLLFSQKLLPSPEAPVTVVTSSYHVFRAALLTRALGLQAHVVGAPTAWYYLPSAIIREFVAVMRDHLRVHAVAVAGILVLTVAFTVVIIPATVIPEGM